MKRRNLVAIPFVVLFRVSRYDIATLTAMRLTAQLAVRVLLAVIILLGLSTSLLANSILYTFTGSHNLTGSFTLDDATPFTTRIEHEELLADLTSPIQMIWGTYGDYTFKGTSSLHILRQPVFFSNGTESLAPDNWIVRSSVSGPALNGRSPTSLNLFIYTSPGVLQPDGTRAGIGGASLTPPPIKKDFFDFNYSIAFSDGTWNSPGDSLTTLVMVPEPSTLVLLSIGLVAVGLVRRKRGTKGLCT
jgi:hypothetical protein